MKKLLLLGSAVFAFTASVNAQSNFVVETTGPIAKYAPEGSNTSIQAKVASANIVDTLWYFYNKHFYRNPASTGFYTLKNAPSYTSTTAATQGGAVFKNSGTIAVTGAEGVVIKQASSPSASVSVGLFLYNVVAGIPSGAPVASVVTTVTNTTQGEFIGGNFAVPAIVTGDYAILMQNVSTNPLDTVRLFINNALQASATSTNNAAKYGEGFGVIRVGTSTFSTTTGLFIAGGDLEFLVAARVAYSVTASATTQTASPCLFTPYTYSNTSSSWIGHRQYNLNQFAVQWLPFANTASTSLSPDPVYTWAWGDATPATTTNGTVTSVSKSYNVAGAYTASLIAKHQKMSDYANIKTSDQTTFAQTATACGPVGINTVAGFENFNLFPNPAVSGKTNITGLVGTNVITVYNMLGQVAFTQTTSNDAASIDLSSQATGNYFIRITNSNNVTKTVKVINQ